MIPNSALPFSGGLVSQGLQRLGVHDSVLLRLRVAAIVILPLLAWLPLLLLSTFDGKLLPGSVGTPFLFDLSAHIRLLVALPLFILAARMGEARILPTLQQFLARRIVFGSSVPKFEAAVASAFRLGDSIAADLLIIAIIYFFDTLVARRTYVANDVSTWYAAAAAAGSHLNPAGICYAYFSLPIFQFVLLRWYLRLFIWARFLGQVSRLKLNLVPTHPDRVGGLGFLIMGTQVFALFAMAHGALLAGWLSTRVIIAKASLTEFKGEIVAIVAFVLFLTIAPLTVFARPLNRAKRRGVIEYGALAARYANEFRDKWIVPESDCEEPLVGSADIQSLADMAGSYEIVQTMRNVPITAQMIVGFAVATLLPVAPLVLTLMPLSEILKKVAGILF
ncbi:MAG TPA: hypothetical protein VK755_13730 [Candidatus Acidoferrales bacterium]|nr:hypothetical protein [Candidatus Acidoferrales bacterium]